MPSARSWSAITLSIRVQVSTAFVNVYVFFVVVCANRITIIQFPIFTVVKNEKLVSVVEDVMANDYVSGEGVKFFTQASFGKRWQDQEIGRKETKMFRGVDELEKILGLSALRPMRNAEGNLFLKSMMPLNTVCFRGHTYRKADNKATTKFKLTQNGRGHWGQNIYPGVAAHRTGLSGDGFIQQNSGGWQADF